MNWSECSEVEQIPGKVSGQPVVKGTRILADTIVEELWTGFPCRGNPRKLSIAARREDPQADRLRSLTPTATPV